MTKIQCSGGTWRLPKKTTGLQILMSRLLKSGQQMQMKEGSWEDADPQLNNSFSVAIRPTIFPLRIVRAENSNAAEAQCDHRWIHTARERPDQLEDKNTKIVAIAGRITIRTIYWTNSLSGPYHRLPRDTCRQCPGYQWQSKLAVLDNQQVSRLQANHCSN